MGSSGGAQLNRSYFYGYDHRFGHGYTSFFTYFSEFNRSWKGYGEIEAAIMIVLFVISVLGNFLVLGLMFKYKRSLTVTNYFVCNLAIANILFAMSSPFLASVRLSSTWRLGRAMCGILNYGMFLCAIVIIWTMTVISIDRYICINMSTTTKFRMTTKHVVIICAVIWVVSGVSFLPIALFFHVKDIRLDNKTITFCTLLWPNSETHSYSLVFTCLVVILGFLIPLVIITVNYFRIFRKFWASKKAVANVTRSNTWNRSSRIAKRNRDQAIVKTLALLVMLFVVMWMPLFVVFGLIQHDATTETMNISSSALVWTIIIAYVNPLVNSVMYGSINTEVRRRIQACCSRGKVQAETSEGSKTRVNDRRTLISQENASTHM